MQMQKRIVCLYIILASMSITVFFRIYYISQNNSLATVSNNQSSYIIDVTSQRGMIYDCNLKPMVNTKDSIIASVIPSPQTIAALIDHIDLKHKDELLSKIKENKPFLIKVKDYNIYQEGINIINIKERYQDNQIATHIIGYTDGSGNGVSGIEKSYNNFFKNNINKIKIKYQTDALNNNYSQTLPVIDYGDRDNKYGIALTIDKRIQKITEKAAISISKGAVIVMDAQNGDLKAVASFPKYNPNKIYDYLKDPDSCLLNRAFCAYNVGSTYKLLVSCAALEQDFDKFIKFKSTCVGQKQISTNIFKCHFLSGHGTINMTKALEISCNPYFINLALEVGPINIINLSKNIGFGSSDILAENIITNRGSLPDKSNLKTQSDVANLGFGQGSLTATPLHIAKMIAMIANDGYLAVPRLVIGKTDKTGSFIEKKEKQSTQIKLISAKTAKTIKNMMISVVENGSGKKAKPKYGGAGGKTASAQTGQYDKITNKEIVHAWFAGFFPASSPKYVIVVLVEGGDSGSDVAAPVFKEIADNILSKPSLLK